MKVICLLVLGLACANAAAVQVAGQTRGSRIVGGSVTTIDQYPTMVSMLGSWDQSTYWQTCGGTILNTRSILTAAHCPVFEEETWRARVGSTWANSGGYVYTISYFISHPDFDKYSYLDCDIAIGRTATPIVYVANAVQPASIAGPNYIPPDNSVVWATGWGAISSVGPASEQLRHVQVWTINQQICDARYGYVLITENMLCSGWLDVGLRDQCTGDSGGPLYHNGVVVGICSWGGDCASAHYPGVNTRVSQFTDWIVANA